MTERAFERQLANRFKLHKLYYYDVRQTFDLPANFRLCRLCPCRCCPCAATSASSRPSSLVPACLMMRGCLRFLNLHEVSLTTLDGRIRVGMVMGRYQEGLFEHVKTAAELVFRDGAYYLMAVVEHADEPPVTPDDFLGVDMGVVNIATDSDGEVHSGTTARPCPYALRQAAGAAAKSRCYCRQSHDP